MSICQKSATGLHRQEYLRTGWGADVYICMDCQEIEEQYIDCNGG